MKKFYERATASRTSDGYVIMLDGKPVKTPSRAVLAASSEPLAAAVAAEWDAQQAEIIPDTMPLTQILTTYQDHVPAGRAEMTKRVMAYLDTDLLCYRVAEPPALVAAQSALWDPFLTWFEQEFGTRLETTTGLRALSQPSSAHRAMADYIAAVDNAVFTILQMAVPLTGSLVLGLSFINGHSTVDDIQKAAHVEEDYKATIYNEAFYGSAPQQEKSRNAMKRDLDAARKFLDLLKN